MQAGVREVDAGDATISDDKAVHVRTAMGDTSVVETFECVPRGLE